MEERKIKIGTRASKLALVQTDLVIEAIKEVCPDLDFEIVTYDTVGDKNLDKPLTEFGSQGIFVEEFEEKILNGEIDIAIHSAKDMPIELPKGLEILSVLKREDPRDVLVTTDIEAFKNKRSAIVGTSSLRRELQIKRHYSNVQCKPIRGNVIARLEQLESGIYDGIVLAAAGLKRLNLHQEARYQYKYFGVDEFIPAPGQGIIAIEGREDNRWIDILHKICDKNSRMELLIERSLYSLWQASSYEDTDFKEAYSIYSKVKNDTADIWILKKMDGEIKKVNIREKIDSKGGFHGKSIFSWSRAWE
ncbi:MAG: hydroxymethylbilane synthase [Clostridiales bacterium]|nr:hydroxymethylbilane synthase [Clostridiales bacterium]